MKLVKKMVGFALAGIALTLVGCKQEVSRTQVETIVKKTVVEVTPTISVDVNTDVSALAVRKVDNARTVIQSSARAGQDDFTVTAEDSLLAVKNDGSVESFMKTKTTVTDDSTFEVVIQKKTIITYEDGSTKEKVVKNGKAETITAKELRDGYATEDGEVHEYEVDEKLSASGDINEMLENSVADTDEVVMPAVHETYQCRYQDNIDEVARGTYIIYQNSSSDGKTSQMSYVYPDGTVFDIFNFDGLYWSNGELSNRSIQRDMKAHHGDQYLQFDKRGNAYIAVYDWSDVCGDDSGRAIYKFNPATKKVTVIGINNKAKNVFYNGFAVDDDGQNIFTGEIECDGGNFDLEDSDPKKYQGYTTVNSYRIVDGKAPVKTELYRSKVYENAVQVPVYLNKKLYFYVNDYNNLRTDTGLYIASEEADGSYKTAVVYKNPTQYSIVDLFLKNNYEQNGNKFDYKAILDYFFDNFCVAGEKEFRLDRLYATKEEYEENGKGALYTDKKDVEALKYLLDDGTDNVITLLNDYSKWDADGDGSQDIFHKFMSYIWDQREDNNNRFPFEKLIFKKGTNETAFATPKEFYSTTLGCMNINGTKLIASEDGIFFINEYNESAQAYEYLELFQICDKDGKFIGEMPYSLDPKVLKIHPNHNKNTLPLVYNDTTTWYKSPIQATEKGIVMMSKDKKTLYYYYNGVAQNILINDSSYGAIDEILTFDATSSSVFYNAKAGSKYFTKKINLADFTVAEVKLDEQVGSIMEFHDSKISTNNYGSSVKFTVTLAENPKVEVSTTKTTSDLTLKVTNFTEKAGYKVKWECMGKVLSKSDTLVMKAEDFAEGKYPITVVASKDGVIISDFISVEIKK